MGEWQPIETAPKDGTEILTKVEHFDPIIAWFERKWFFFGRWENGVNLVFYNPDGSMTVKTTYKPTRWMLIPKPPEEISNE